MNANNSTVLYRVVRSKYGRNWDIVARDGRIVEGGFFSRDAAQDSCDEWNRQALRAKS